MTNEEIRCGLSGAIGALRAMKKKFPATEEVVQPAINACQEAIEALWDKESYKPCPGPELKYVTDCCCGFCDASIFREDLFCRVCGNPVDWSDE